jgi:hypothetical protein
MQSPGQVGDTFSFGDKFVQARGRQTRGVDAMLAKFFGELCLGDIVGHQGPPTKFSWFLRPGWSSVARNSAQATTSAPRRNTNEKSVTRCFSSIDGVEPQGILMPPQAAGS